MVSVEALRKSFGRVRALAGVSFEVERGEFLALLGPSGCGKTTTLRILAGLERQDEGELYIGGEEVSEIPAHRRDIRVVFQDYALLPHMTVFHNVALGLRLRRGGHAEVERRDGD